MENWKHEFIRANGIRTHYVTAGKGPLVVLLHGFPEFWYAWRHQIGELAEHFQVVVPDLRGYGDTERPPNISDYDSSHLVLDIAGLIEALGHKKAHLVGHDWGGAVAWRLAMQQPQLVDRLVVLNCPHPYKFAEALRTNRRQMGKSWYIFFFQIPYLPELFFKLSPKKFLDRVFKGVTFSNQTINNQDLEVYRQALEKPRAFEAALNYYRAAFRKTSQKDPSQTESNKKIKAPTLLIWGEDDPAMGKELTEGMESLFEGPFSIRFIPNCGHWVNEQQPELVNQLLVDFLA